jgi:hypothetical protein
MAGEVARRAPRRPTPAFDRTSADSEPVASPWQSPPLASSVRSCCQGEGYASRDPKLPREDKMRRAVLGRAS